MLHTFKIFLGVDFGPIFLYVFRLSRWFRNYRNFLDVYYHKCRTSVSPLSEDTLCRYRQASLFPGITLSKGIGPNGGSLLSHIKPRRKISQEFAYRGPVPNAIFFSHGNMYLLVLKLFQKALFMSGWLEMRCQ